MLTVPCSCNFFIITIWKIFYVNFIIRISYKLTITKSFVITLRNIYCKKLTLLLFCVIDKTNVINGYFRKKLLEHHQIAKTISLHFLRNSYSYCSFYVERIRNIRKSRNQDWLLRKTAHPKSFQRVEKYMTLQFIYFCIQKCFSSLVFKTCCKRYQYKACGRKLRKYVFIKITYTFSFKLHLRFKGTYNQHFKIVIPNYSILYNIFEFP